MPTESTYPRIDIPDVDIWTLLFEKKDREFPNDKGGFFTFAANLADANTKQ